jgi:hypothetical protein
LKAWTDKVSTAQVEIYKQTETFDFEKIKDLVTGVEKPEPCLAKLFQEYNDRIKTLIGANYSAATYEIYESFEFIQTKFKMDDMEMKKLKLDFIERLEVFYRVEKLNQTNTISCRKFYKK